MACAACQNKQRVIRTVESKPSAQAKPNNLSAVQKGEQLRDKLRFSGRDK